MITQVSIHMYDSLFFFFNQITSERKQNKAKQNKTKQKYAYLEENGMDTLSDSHKPELISTQHWEVWNLPV